MRWAIKGVFDKIAATLALIIMAPVMVGIALALDLQTLRKTTSAVIRGTGPY